MKYEDRLFEDLCDNVKGFEQFKNHPENCEIAVTDLRDNTCHFYVNLSRFDGIDTSNINCYSFGPVDGTYFRNITGSVSSGGPDGISINFKADSRSAVKCVFGYLTDGPHTTLMPETLENILKEKNIDEDLIQEIMGTISAQSSVNFNEGWMQAKDLYKKDV